LQQTLKGYLSLVNVVVFSLNGKLVASSDSDRTVKFWDVATGALQQTLKAYSILVSAIAFSLDGKLVASSSYNKTVKL